MIFFSSGKKAVSARTLGWVLSRGSARWCEALGALTPAPSPSPPPGAPARPPSPPPASPKEEEKRPLGEGREAGAASRRFRAENSSKGRAALSAVPAPPPHPLKILWKLLPTSSGTFLHFQADKALSTRRPGTGFLGRGKSLRKPRSAAWSSARSEPQKWWESPQASEPPGAAGLAALATPVLLKEWLVLR